MLDAHLGEKCEEEPHPDHVLPPDGDVSGGGEAGEDLSDSVSNEAVMIPGFGVGGDASCFKNISADSEDEEKVESGEVLPGCSDGVGASVEFAGSGVGYGLAFCLG